MTIEAVKIDLSNAKENQAGDIYDVRLVLEVDGKEKEVTLQSDARGVTRQIGPGDGIAIQNHHEVKLDWRFAESACKILGYDVSNELLMERGSTSKIRVFMPGRSKRI